MTAIAVKERPIIFSETMVRAILGGSKTQTRRVMKPQPLQSQDGNWDQKVRGKWAGAIDGDNYSTNITSPHGLAGDRLWVRETWANLKGTAFAHDAAYRADAYTRSERERYRLDYGAQWQSPYHMFRWASRITLEIIDVRLQPVQAISREDTWAEGIPGKGCKDGQLPDGEYCPVCDAPRYPSGIDGGTWVHNSRISFEQLWNTVGAKREYSWDINPWVWAITFKVVKA